MSNINTQVPIDPVAAAGATAQTSGFVQPTEPLPSSSSSPAVPSAVAPAATSSTTTAPPVAPATAILGSAGIPAQFGYMGGAFGVTNTSGGLQSSPNVPAPGSSIDHSTGKPFSAGMTRAELEAKNAADLSGREQAARQLAGPGLGSAAPPAETPLKELPGGWGRE
jgi:hypothetical protein